MWTHDSIFGLFLVAGLAGGLGHCSGMCGPLVVLVAPGKQRVQRAVGLHAGRMLSYALLGGLLALLAHLVGGDALPTGGRRWGLALVGLLLLLAGLAALRLPFLRLSLLEPRPGSRIAGCLGQLARLPGIGGSFALGLFWGFIPCGLLYTAYAAALGAGTEAPNPVVAWLSGALVCLLFGLGTTPTLAAIGLAAASLPDRLRLVLQRVAALVVAASGIILLWRAFST